MNMKKVEKLKNKDEFEVINGKLGNHAPTIKASTI